MKGTNRWSAAFLAAMGLTACGGGEKEPEPPKDPIHVRLVMDLTGPTNALGGPISNGLLDHLAEVNANGGIRGHQVEIEIADHQYNVQKGLEIYAGWKTGENWDKVVTIFGYASPDSLALAPEAGKDEKMFITGAPLASLASPVPVSKTISVPGGSDFVVNNPGYPWTFIPTTDYSTQARLAVEFAKKKGATKVAFAYCDNAGCAGAVPAAKTHAQSLGITFPAAAEDIVFGVADTQATLDTKLQTWFQTHQDYEWIVILGTNASVPKVVMAVDRFEPAGKTVKLVTNNVSFDEGTYGRCNTPEGVNSCVDRIFGAVAYAAYGDTRFPGMEAVVSTHDAARAAKGEDATLYANVPYVQGYSTFLVWKSIVEELADSGQEINAANLKAAYESASGVQTGGLLPPISYSATDHRPSGAAKFYGINSFGKLQFQDDVEFTNLNSDNLGW